MHLRLRPIRRTQAESSQKRIRVVLRVVLPIADRAASPRESRLLSAVILKQVVERCRRSAPNCFVFHLYQLRNFRIGDALLIGGRLATQALATGEVLHFDSRSLGIAGQARFDRAMSFSRHGSQRRVVRLPRFLKQQLSWHRPLASASTAKPYLAAK